MKKTASKEGGALALVMIIVLAVVILSLGLMKLHDTNAVEAVWVEQTDQAFWLAESGMQLALHRLRTDAGYRETPYDMSDAFGNGSFYASVQKMSASSNQWSITSTGTVHGVSRILKLSPLLTAEVGYAIMGLGGDSTLNNAGDIDGNIYNFGELLVNGNTTPNVNGEVLALALDAAEGMDFTPLTANDEVQMSIDSSEFNFNPSPADALSLISTNGVKYIDLTGTNAVVVNGDLNIPADVAGTIGGGMLVVNGDLKFSSAGDAYTVHDGATILVDGQIWAQKDGVFGDDVLVYTTGSMTIFKAGTGESVTFQVEGDFYAHKDLDFMGLIFVEGKVQVDGNLNLEGALISQEFWLKKDYTIVYNENYIPQDVLDNMVLYVVYAAHPGTWRELPSM